jgi:colanic acid biosynthesis glycosyl transferase WcaI
MRILVHDYSGHPFQVQLSRALAGRGHDVLHVHCASYQTGKGAVFRRDGDPPNLEIDAIDLGRSFDRYVVVRRLRQELSYGAAFGRRALRFDPEIIVSSNDPLFAKTRAALWCRRHHVPWVFWLQDIYSVAMAAYASRRFGALGRLLGRGFQAIERRLLLEATDVVAITEDFRPVLQSWDVPDAHCHVIENWAPLEDLDVRPKDNPWSRAHDLHDKRVLLYSGTLGLKHDPHLLTDLARRHKDDGVVVVVVSQGAGASWLEREKQVQGLDNLLLLPYQPFDALPDVLGTADVLLTLLDPGAAVFSVPSKILTYLCAGRPILAAMPLQNLGAHTIERAGAGIVVSPKDIEGFLDSADALLADPQRCQAMGASARAYAERTFDIESIADRFEDILTSAVRRTPGRG